ncbi:MAG: hypothetical protein NC823_02455, partial [Candidatus Omnitrophica bacterium]|nr:hypothetical protein [Candidatus Omnitrophota bacterium]
MIRTWRKIFAGLFFGTSILLAGSVIDEVLLYVPFDSHLDALTGQGGLLPATFVRKSEAYTLDLKKFSSGQPRFVPGRFGQGIFLEAGDYGDYTRGTKNNLPPDRDQPVLPAGLTP